MSTFGRILAFFVLFMSIVFLVISFILGASQLNWKEMAIANRDRANTLQRLLNSARETQTTKERQLRSEAVARQQQIAHLNAELQIARSSLDLAVRNYQTEQATSRERLTALSNAETRLSQQDRDIAELRNSQTRLTDEIASLKVNVVSLNNVVNETRLRAETLETINQDLSEKLAHSVKVLKSRGDDLDTPLVDVTPKLEGVITYVNNDLIVFQLGTDDGLREGHVLDVHRGGRFLGRARVTKSDYNYSVARMMKEFQQAAVIEGDNVTTKF